MDPEQCKALDKAIELLADFAKPGSWELLGGHYYRHRPTSLARQADGWPHERVAQAITLLHSLKGV